MSVSKKLVDKEKPDFVVLGGDNCDGDILKTEAEFDKYLDILMFMHIPLWEFQYIVDNPEATFAKGSMVETMEMGKFNSGLFAASYNEAI